MIYVFCLRDVPDAPFTRGDLCAWTETQAFLNPWPQKAGFAAAASAQ